MTRAEGLSVLHPIFDQPAGRTDPVATAAAAVEVEALDEVVVAVAGRALKTFIRQDPPHGCVLSPLHIMLQPESEAADPARVLSQKHSPPYSIPA